MSHTTRKIYEGRVVRLDIDSIRLPNGVAATLEIVRHPGGAAVVALNEEAQVCMLRQYRHAAGAWLWELPAGKRDHGEAAAVTAARELAEEAGLKAGRWDELGEILVTPGFCDERIQLFLARDLAVTPARREAGELIEVHWMSMEDALQKVFDGDIRDAKTMLGLVLAEKQANRQDAHG